MAQNNLFFQKQMLEKIKQFFYKILQKRTLVIWIESPDYNVQYMFLQSDQTVNTYKFLCSRYIKLLKEWDYSGAKILEKLVTDYIVMWEGQKFMDFKHVLNIK